MKINFLQIIIKLFIDDISIFYIIKCIILIEKNNTNKIKLKLTPRIYILPPKKKKSMRFVLQTDHNDRENSALKLICLSTTTLLTLPHNLVG